MAIGVLRYLKEHGLSVPHDISLIGFDDVEADIYLDPPLTTMRVPKIDMGIEAIRLMVDFLNNNISNPRKVLVPAELIVRQSTCSAA
jgi:DNA-binding LacI/PurR family transcriptional regulator